MRDNDEFNFIKSNNNGTDMKNFFLKSSSVPQETDFIKTRRHLNDYDLNLLEENAYKDIPDETFRLEYEISKIEKELKSIGTKLMAAKAIRDTEEQLALFEQKVYLETYYDSLIKQYNNRGTSAKVSDYISYMFGNSNYQNTKKSFISKLISKIPKSFKKLSEIDASLRDLKYINKSTDELLNKTSTPTEDFSKYSQLSKYLIKANSLQTEIENFIKNKK